MKIYLFENKRDFRHKKSDIIQVFGLSQSGKTTYLKNLAKKSHNVLLVQNAYFFRRLLFLFFHFLKNPLKVAYIFFKLNRNWIRFRGIPKKSYLKIFLMRNSYMGAALANYEIALNERRKIFLDESLVQSLFMIIQTKSSKKEFLELFNRMGIDDKVLLIENDEKTRYERLYRIRFPGEQINKTYALEWMKNMEFNYKIIKQILQKKYDIVKKNPVF